MHLQNNWFNINL